METKHIMSEISKNKCRTCLQTNTTLKSLNSKPKMLKINKTYMDLLRYVTHLEMSDGEEDRCKNQYGICCKCCKRIRDAYMFIKQVQKCNSYFVDDSKSTVELETNDSGLHCVDNKLIVVKEEAELLLNDSFNEINAADTGSSIDNNCGDLPLSIFVSAKLSQGESDVNSFHDIEIKKENNNYLEEFQPLCALTETTFTYEKEQLNSENDLDRINCINSKCEDPLDSEDTKDDTVNGNEDDGYSKNNDPENDDRMLPVKCDECEKIFANSLFLNRHKKDTHIPDELKIQCPKCPVKFSRRYNMYSHMRSFHKTETVRAHQIQPRKLIKTDVCEQCNRAYSDKYKLMAHIKDKHGPESSPKKEKQPPKRYLCTLCGLTCSSQSNLDIHYRRHTGEKPFKCDFCSRAYARLYDVQVHRRIHTGETPFKCTICEKAFKRSNKLKIHMRTHTNERPYKCTQCEKAFKQSKDLNIHKRTHTGERPYKCNICLSTFTQSNSLKLHQTKTKHNNI